MRPIATLGIGLVGLISIAGLWLPALFYADPDVAFVISDGRWAENTF